jgi:hypothetical protein
MVIINSKSKWNDTGIDLIKGDIYQYETQGHWTDWYIKCDADGFSNFFLDIFSWTKREPSANWFQLIGVVDKNSVHTILLGKNGSFSAPASGRLWAYANDAKFAYVNNSGSIELVIQRLE